MANAHDPLQPERCAEVLAALAAPERLRIIRLLAGGERNVSQITAEAGIDPLNVSHHLSVLQRTGLVCRERRGRFVYYSITPAVLGEVIDAGVSKESLDLGCCQLVLPADEP